MNTSTRPVHTHHRILLGLGLSTAAVLALAVAGNAQPGTLDPDFSADGKVTVQFTSGDVRGYAVVPDWIPGGFFVAGYQDTEDDNSIAITRVAQDGSLVNAFDGDGKLLATFDENGPFSRAYGIARSNTSQTIVAVGDCKQAVDQNGSFGVARFEAGNGAFDQDFSGDGRIIFNFVPGADCRAWDVVVTPDDKIIVAGWSRTSDDPESVINFAVARLNENGTLDNTFSTDGKVMVDFNGTDAICHAVAVQPDGKIILAGTSTTEFAGYYAVARLNEDGTLDQNFAGNGSTIFEVINTSVNEDAWDIALQSDGRIVIAGQADMDKIGLLRLLPTGSLDPDFGDEGRVITSAPGSGSCCVYGVEIEADDQIVCVGYVYGSDENEDLLVANFLNSGVLNTEFGSDGFAIATFGNGYEIARDVHVEENGRITAVGVADMGTDGLSFAMARFYEDNTIGMPDQSFEMGTLLLYPNPFTESTTITYTLNERTELSIELQDLQGRTITFFLNGKEMPAGEHRQTVTMPADLVHGNYLLVFTSPEGRMNVQVNK